MNFFKFFLLLAVPLLLEANTLSGEALAKRLHLSAGTKAVIQWERVFKSERKKRKYKIETLSPSEQDILKEYLISHAIDSDKPTVAGE
jgi:hypothetical protein